MRHALLFSLIIVLVLAGCGGRQPTPTPVSTAVAEGIPTDTDTPIPPTATPVPTVTPIVMPTLGATPSPTPTNAATRTPTATATPYPTDTPTLTPTDTATSTPTGTPTPTATATATPTESFFAVEYLGCESPGYGLGSVKGQVFDRSGRVIPGAQVEIWIDGHHWDNPANPAATNQDGWYEWILALGQVVRFVALYIDDQEMMIYPDDLEVPSVSGCFQHVNFRQE